MNCERVVCLSPSTQNPHEAHFPQQCTLDSSLPYSLLPHSSSYTVAVRTHPHRIVCQNTTLSTHTQHAVDPETPETLTLAFNQPLLTKTQYCWSATHGPEERHEPHNTTNPHTVSEFEARWLRRSDTHHALWQQCYPYASLVPAAACPRLAAPVLDTAALPLFFCVFSVVADQEKGC